MNLIKVVLLGIITIALSKSGRLNSDLDGYKSAPELRHFLFSRGGKIKHKEIKHNKLKKIDVICFCL